MANRLKDSLSPYLLQHADNPVDWHPWGPEAFEEARRRDVPLFVSVGYASCHWCHVMAHESFEDPDTAAELNRDFVSVKVDREERPDVDAIYMAATTAMTGSGGWPMSVWLDHDGRVFLAGTYFPPRPAFGRPSFRQVLGAVAEAWQRRRPELLRSAAAIDAELAKRDSSHQATQGAEPESITALAVAELAATYEPATGGFGGAPKFPQAMVLEFLLRHHEQTGSRHSLEMVERTCEAMARGGIYDQLAGGFARYSVDAQWLVPHFEKMLYDNALLLRVYTHLWCRTESDLARRVARETAEFLVRDLRTDSGGFASALDADASPPDDPAGRPEEGASYAWTPDQLDAVLGPEDGQWAAELLGVTLSGTFEHGTSTLTLHADPDDVERWQSGRTRLLAARDERPQPARDDKVVASWNGLAITALAQAGVAFDEPKWVAAAESAAGLLVHAHLDDSARLRRVSRHGRAGDAPGMLDDYGNVIEAFATLFAVTGDTGWYTRAAALTDAMVAHFTEDGGFADSPDDGEQLVRRPRDPADNATPSGVSAAITALLIMSSLSGRLDWRETAETALAGLVDLQQTHPRFAGWSLAALLAAATGPVQVAVVGDPEDPATAYMLRTAFREARCGAVIARGTGADADAHEVELLRDRLPGPRGRPTGYVCEGFACRLPVTTAEELAEQLESVSAGNGPASAVP